MNIDDLIEALGGGLTPREAARWSSRTSALHQRAREQGLGRYLPALSEEPAGPSPAGNRPHAAYEAALQARLQRSRARKARTQAASQPAPSAPARRQP